VGLALPCSVLAQAQWDNDNPPERHNSAPMLLVVRQHSNRDIPPHSLDPPIDLGRHKQGQCALVPPLVPVYPTDQADLHVLAIVPAVVPLPRHSAPKNAGRPR
ncbi:MAG TPA: hypothetical protein VIY29_18325, partial [Ktedonobacteraceae bacterium]